MRQALLTLIASAMLLAAAALAPAAAAGVVLWPAKIATAPYVISGMTLGADGSHHVILYDSDVSATGRYATDRGGAWRVQNLSVHPFAIALDAQDNPVVMGFGSDHDYLYRGDGIAPLTRIEIPDPAQWWSPSFKADIKATGDGLIHFATNGDTQHSVAYATYDGSAWSGYTMASPAGLPVVNDLALAVDGSGVPHVIVAGPYADACPAAGCVSDIAMTEPTTAQDIGVARGSFLVAATGPDGSVEVVGKEGGLLWHASNGSGGWTSETVVDYYPNATGSLVQGPNGMVILYCDGANVVRADWTGSAWTVTPIHAGRFEGYGAVDAADVAHVGYMSRQSGTGIDDAYVAAPDTAGPIATAPIVRPRAGGIVGSKVPTRITWSGSDNLSGWATAMVRQRTNGGSWTTIGSDLTSTSVKRTLAQGSTTFAFTVRGTDKAGNTGDWATGPTVRLAVKSQANRMIKYSGAWSSAHTSGYLGGSARTATSTSASATITFTGRAFAWIGKYGSGYGSAKIWVDGVLKATVSSHRKSTTYRPIVWSIAWSTSATHTIVIKPAGSAGHPRIVIDGIVTVR